MPKKIVTSQYEGSYSGTNASHDPNSFIYDDAGVISYKDSENTPAQLFIKPGTFYGSGYDGGEIGGRPTIKLVPDIYASPDQHIVIDATEPDHIHIRAGGTKDASNAVLILGAENTNVEVSDMSGRVIINSNNGQFLQNSVPENQIATLGNVGIENSYAVQGGTTGTQPTFDGDPLFSASYVRMSSDLVHFQIQVDMDNITSFGTGQYYMTLPFNSKYAYQFREGCLHDIGGEDQFQISGHVAAGSNMMYLFFAQSAAQDEAFTSTAPVVLQTNDNFHISGTYVAQASF